MADIDTLLSTYTQSNQAHIFAYLDELTPDQKQVLLQQARNTDLQAMKFLFEKLYVNPDPQIHKQIQPYTNHTRISDLSVQNLLELRQRGLQLLGQGAAGLIMLAGGQASRLGVPYPKGMYDISLLSHKTFFQIYAQKILKLKELSGAQNHLPWAIMTNTQTRAEVFNFFSENQFFGLDPQQVNIFPQDMIPALDFEGKILLADKNRLVLSPNGNGGAFESLGKQRVIEWFQERGVSFVHFCGVDNILLKICDPVLLGFTHSQEVEVCTKTVQKIDPKDPMGVLGLKGGKQSVVEYSQLSDEMAEARNPDGKLVYGLGNILNHFFRLDFIKRVLQENLDQLRSKYHLARKKVPHYAGREFHKPTEPNGLKFELFYFDILPLANSSAAMVADRESEFAPVKNADGPDSPESARMLVARLHSRWAEQAGAVVSEQGREDCFCEIAPAVSYDGEGLEFLAGQRIEFPYRV